MSQPPNSGHLGPDGPEPGQQPHWASQPAYTGGQPSAYGPRGGVSGPPTGGSAVSQGKGLLGSLFDFSFRHFATPHIVRVVYILATVLLALFALFMMISGFSMLGSSRTAGTGVATIILTPLGFLLYLALIRMTMEMYVAMTRAADEVSRIRDLLERR